MTGLRSGKVVSVVQNEHSHEPTKNGVQIEPLTPAKEVESTTKSSNERTPSPHKSVQSSDKIGSAGGTDSASVSNQALRRSARLSSKSIPFDHVEIVRLRKRRKAVNHGNCEASSTIDGSVLVSAGQKESGGSGSYGSNNIRASSELTTLNGFEANGILVSDLDAGGFDKEETPSVQKVNIQRLLSQVFQFNGSESVQESDVGNKSSNLRSGRKLSLPEVNNVSKDKEMSPSQEEKGTEEEKSETVVNGVSTVNFTFEVTEGSSGSKNGGEKTRKRLSREDKQKGVLVDSDEGLEKKIKTEVMEIEEKGKGKVGEVDSSSNSSIKDDLQVTLQQETIQKAETSTRNKERFKNVAKENASRFAYFSLQEEKEEEELLEDENELEPQTEENKVVEDWPGPFSTAMKIIKDREENTGQQNTLTSEKPSSVPLIWVPKVKHHGLVKRESPSLQELCIKIMAQNVDAITSLESVPDVIRHKLTRLLCHYRKMNHHFFNLLASGSPTEIRVQDCSWLSEEQLTKTFEKADTSKLTVLQLDQCGRCLPDYVLFATLAHLPMSELTNISLRGACRLSDAGLNALVTSAPSLRSINLGCCSLLTSDGIINLADKLGPILKELYIDECSGLDAMKILPALLKLEHLEVLSISGFETVNDTFIKQLVGARGQSMKELVLADCMKLTDKSLKAIAESCPDLCSIDLTNLTKLTDAAIGHLANGCPAIQMLKFCRNAFSDEAVAAYLEACGKSLKELSLNHVNKVANHTALSLSKHARKLQSLDLSWCRNMTNEAVGLIVDNCVSLKTLILFGCTQITDVFLNGHSNESVKVNGLKDCQILKNIELADLLPLKYSSAA